MTTTRQIFIAAKGTHIGFKVVAHNSDPNQLVIKAKHPEIGSLLAMTAGISASALRSERGSSYFLTFVPRAEFEAGLGKVVLDIMNGNLNVSFPESVPVYNDISDADDEDDVGGPDEDEDDDEDEDEEDGDDGDDY